MKAENVLVTGSNGQLGMEIQKLEKDFSNFNFVFTDVNSLDICDFNKVKSFISFHKITTIINCAAYTNVDGAEDNKDLANLVNFEAVKNLGEVAKENNLKLVHISTDYVFDGDGEIPYKEDSVTNPKNIYGLSKLKGEEILRKINPNNTIIIRTSWLYSSYGANFVKTMCKLLNEKESVNVVNDQIGSPTYALNLAKEILNLIPSLRSELVETYHYSNSGSCSWFQFAEEIALLIKSDCKINKVSSEYFNSKAYRPKYSVLDTRKIESDFHLKMVPWQVALKSCLEIIKKN